jgi:hypothetical protein
LRAKSPTSTGITKPESGELRRPKTLSAHALLIKVVVAEETAVAVKKAAVETRKVVAVAAKKAAAEGDKNKQSTQLQG